jgi:membrane fusion protein, heavy metal efflux system
MNYRMTTTVRTLRIGSCVWILVAGAGPVRAIDAEKAARLANTVFLDEKGVKNLRLETAEAEEQTFEETLHALGKIEAFPGKRQSVSSRIAGRAVRVLALPDHEVKAGDPLVVVESRQPGEPPPQVTLVAPISGFVVDLAVAPGDPVSPDKALVGILDLSRVHAVAHVPEHHASRLRRGLKVRMTSPGWPGEMWETEVAHVGAVADPATGTLEVACYVDNEGLWLRPGMRAEFDVVTRTRPGLMSVPKAAVQGEGANRFVYVADDAVPHAFVKVPVVVGGMNDRFVEISEGLFPGDKVVTTGSYSLAHAGKGSVSLKEALDAAHGHEHNEDGSEKVAGAPAASEADHGHSHGVSAAGVVGGGFVGRLTPLTWFSLIGNGVLLVLLGLASRRRGTDVAVKGDVRAE